MLDNLNCLTQYLWRRNRGEKELNEDRRRELFTLYFKCSINDETVMNVKMSFGGIGVAICDINGCCVFELQKPAGEQGVNDDHHLQVVQIQSFIDTLNAAVTLGHKRLRIFSNSYPVYQYVTGSLKPSTNNKIATLVRELNLIRRKFTYFFCDLVGQDHLRFANKLARGAIDTQVTNFLKCTNIKTLVNRDKFYCPFLKCSALMSRTKLLELDTPSSQETGMRKCVECDRLFCMNCQIPWHLNITCSYFMNYLSDKYFIDPKLKSLAVRRNLLQCKKCQNTIERAAGCYYISCRCGYDFCYNCGAERIENNQRHADAGVQSNPRQAQTLLKIANAVTLVE